MTIDNCEIPINIKSNVLSISIIWKQRDVWDEDLLLHLLQLFSSGNSPWLPWSLAIGATWLPIFSDSGYLFLLRSNIHQESFASAVPLGDGNALPPITLPTPQPAGPSVIAFHDKSGRQSDPIRPCSFAVAFDPTAERKDTLKHRRLEMIIAHLKRHQRQWHIRKSFLYIINILYIL